MIIRQSGIVCVAVAFVAMLVVGVPLALGHQWTFVFLTVAWLAWLAGWRTKSALLTLSILSLIVCTRYIFWPTTQTLSLDGTPGTLLGLGLFAAELSAWFILVVGLLQPASPLELRNMAPDADPESWPLIDLYVPTGDESLEVVRATALATLDMDYPTDRFRVYIMDEGHRPELQALAREIGCGYLTRPDDNHDKPGNLKPEERAGPTSNERRVAA